MLRIAQFFTEVGTTVTARLWLSADGLDFTEELQWNSGLPSGTETPRDGTLLKVDDYWYLVFTDSPISLPVYRSNGPADGWHSYATIDTSSISGIQGNWAPEFFVDDDGSVHIVVVCDTGGIPFSENFTPYEVHPVTPGDLSSWTAPALLTSVGTSTGFFGNVIDPCLRKVGSTYYCFFTNNLGALFYCTSSALLGPYDGRTYVFGDYFGSQPYVEGPCVTHEGGSNWRIYFDWSAFGAPLDVGVIHAATSTDDLATFSNGFTSPALTVDGSTPSILKHGTVVVDSSLLFGNQASIASVVSVPGGGRIVSDTYLAGNFNASSRAGYLRLGEARLGLDPLYGAYPQAVPLNGIATSEAFGALEVIGPRALSLDGIATGEAFGSLTIVLGAAQLHLPGIPSGEAFGALVVAGPQGRALPGIPSGEAFGVLMVTYPRSFSMDGIPSGEAIGSITLGRSQGILVYGIPSGEAFGELDVEGGLQTTKIFIGNVDRSNYLQQGTARIVSQTMGRWSAQFTLLVTDLSYAPALGQTVQIQDFGRRQFAGCISEISVDRVMKSVSKIYFRCSALDKAFVLDHRIVPDKTWTAGTDLAYVCREILVTWLIGEGISGAALPASIDTLDADLTVSYETVTATLDKAAQLAGCNWWVDSLAQLQVRSVSAPADCPFSITETSKNFRNMVSKFSLIDFTNAVYVRSNLSSMPSQNGTPFSYIVPQAEAQAMAFYRGAGVFPVPVASIISLKHNGVLKTVYDGLTSPEVVDATNPLFGHVWWMFPGSTYLAPPGSTTSVPNPPEQPANGDLIEIEYIATVQSTQVKKATSLFTPTRLPGAPSWPGESLGTCGSGLYESVRQVNDVTTPANLQAIADSYIARLGAPTAEVQFETDVPGAEVGQRLTVDVPNVYVPSKTLFITAIDGISEKVDLLTGPQARLRVNGRGNSFRFQITAASTDAGNWQKWFERFYRRSEHPNPVIRESVTTFVISPGGSVTSGVVDTNPKRITQSFKCVEAYAVAGTPPVDQDLYLNIISSGLGVPVLKDPIKIPAGSTALAHVVVFASDPLYIFKNDVLKPTVSYVVTGADPQAAGSVSFDLVGVW